MKVIDNAAGIIEPVTLDEVKDHLGYDPDVTVDDDVMSRNIAAMRQALEGGLDRTIALRSFTVYPDPGPITKLPTPLVSVVSFRAKVDGVDGELADVPYELKGDALEPVISWKLPAGCTDPVLIVRAGFETVPEVIKSAICDMVKAKYDRAPVAPVLDDAVMTCYNYRRVGL
jgi:hypothetical protein